MLKIDVDGYDRQSMLYLEKLFFCLPFPFFVRISSSNHGLHLCIPGLGDLDYRRLVFDDPMRVSLDDNRRVRGLPITNLLWDEKNGKVARPWAEIKSQSDIVIFLDGIGRDLIKI